MPIGSDVVSGMLDLFDKVMSVKGTEQLKKTGAYKTFDPEDVEILQKSPEAQKFHITTDWMNKVLGDVGKPPVEKLFGYKKIEPKSVVFKETPPMSEEEHALYQLEKALKEGLAKTESSQPIKSKLPTTPEGKTDWAAIQAENEAKKQAYLKSSVFKPAMPNLVSPMAKFEPGATVKKKPLGFDPQISSTQNLPPGTAQDPLLDIDPALAMDPKSRLQRAQQAGFTTLAYRGVSRPPRQSSGIHSSYGYYSTADPELAGLYATEFHSGKSGMPAIMPLLLNTADYLVYDAKGKSWANVNDIAISKALDQGKKGVVMQNVFDEPMSTHKLGTPKTVYITLDPTSRRSTTAAFDPKKAKLNDLLASNRAFIVPPGMLEGAQEAKADKWSGPSIIHAAEKTGETLKGMGHELMHPIESIQKDIENFKNIAAGGLKIIENALVASQRGLTGQYGRPGEITSEKPGVYTEEDAARARWAKEQEVVGAGDIAQFAMTGGFAGVEKGAAGAFGGKLAPLFQKGSGPVNLKQLLTPGGAQQAKTMLVPSKELVTDISDDLHRLRQWRTADQIEMSQHLDQFPPEYKTAAVQEEFYHKGEDPSINLSPDKEAFFAQKIQPMREEIQKLQQVAGKYGVQLTDDEWMHRVMKGQEPAPTGGPAALPQEGGTGKLARRTSAMLPRTVYALEHSQSGTRVIISQPSQQQGIAVVWNKGKGTKTAFGDELKVGNPMMINGQQWVVKQAKTKEIEVETPFRYQKSAAVNLATALVNMRSVVRNIQYLDNLTKSPDWLQWATVKGGNRPAPEGWKTPKVPQLDRWLVHPKLRGPIDDFYQSGFEGFDWLRRVNRFAIGSMFWTPIPHVENVAGHWFVGRGWEWLRPSGYENLYKEGAKAIRAAITMNSDYVDLLKHGSAIIAGGVYNRDFYQAMGKKFGLEMQRNGMMAKLEQAIGMKIPNPIGWWYNAMNRVLWQANDIFMMQRIFELERRGLTRLEAIKEAEKHIPNYRIPPEVLGSRTFSRVLQDTALTAFGRYHYGVWNSYTNMVKDMFGPNSTPKQRLDGAGNLAALFVLAAGIYPLVSYGLQKLTGDKDIKKLPRGPATIPSTLYQALSTNEKHVWDVVGNSITLAPGFKETLEQFPPINRDFFTGKHIYQPGEKSVVRKAMQRVEHAAGTMVAPINTLTQIRQSLHEKGIPREILKQAIGTEDRTQRQRRGIAQGLKRERSEAKSARKRPGWLEDLILKRGKKHSEDESDYEGSLE